MHGKTKIDNFLEHALRKMFRMVGEKYGKEFTKDPEWFRKRTWSQEQESEFRDWFVTTARKKMRWSKRLAEREFSWFNFMWGWKMEELPRKGETS